MKFASYALFNEKERKFERYWNQVIVVGRILVLILNGLGA